MVLDLAHLISLGKIILYDLALSGDNAAVIGLAAHRLPARQRRQAMIWGCAVAIVLRIAFTLVVYEMLGIPGLRFVGAILLLWIACKLMQEEVQSAADPAAAPSSLPKAVQRIAMADLVMSLDNVLAIASASRTWEVIVVGLVISIVMLLFLSALITELMHRYRWIAYAAVALLAAAAGEMMWHDLHDFLPYVRAHHYPNLPELPEWIGWCLRGFLVVMCLSVNKWLPAAASKPGRAEEAAPAEGAES